MVVIAADVLQPIHTVASYKLLYNRWFLVSGPFGRLSFVICVFTYTSNTVVRG